MIDSPRKSEPEWTRRSNPKIPIGIAVALFLAGTAFAVRQCAKDDNTSPVTTLQIPERDMEPTPELAPTLPAMPTIAPTDAGSVPEKTVVRAPTIGEACQTVLDAERGGPGAVFNALAQLEEVSGRQAWRPSEIEEVCNFKRADLMRALGAAVKLGDSRIARQVANAFETDCRDRLSDERIAELKASLENDPCKDKPFYSPRDECKRQLRDEALSGCKDIPPGEEKNACRAEYGKRIRRECSSLDDTSPTVKCYADKDRAESDLEQKRALEAKACPRKTAEEYGVDFDQLQDVANTATASMLATTRMVILDPDGEITMDLCSDYFRNLTPAFLQVDNSALFRRLGVRDQAEFKRKYLDEVLTALKSRVVAGDMEKCVRIIDTINSLHDVIK